MLSRYTTEYTTELVIDREVQYLEEKVDLEINTYVQEEVISHIALLKMYTIEASTGKYAVRTVSCNANCDIFCRKICHSRRNGSGSENS